MAKNPRIWIQSASPEEKGSFCDAESGNDYSNVSDFGKAEVISSSAGSGSEAIIVDDVADPDDTFSQGQRWNVSRTEDDDQGSSTPARYGPRK